MTGPDTGTAGPGVPSRDRLLIDLGQELRAMRTELREFQDKHGRLVRDVSEVIGPDLGTLRADVAELRGLVDALMEEPGGAAEEVVLHWPDLTADEAAEAWDQLGQWVHTTMGYWFEVTRKQLPDCWPLHRSALLQLWALRLMYEDAHTSGRASPLGMIEWNTRWLDAALKKIADAIPDTMCRAVAGGPGQHLVAGQQAEQQARIAAARKVPQVIAEAQAMKAARQAREAAAAAAAAGQPGAGSPYSIPQYAAGTAGTAAQPAATAGQAAGWTGVAAEDEVTDPKYWGEYLRQARELDLAWRRERDARLAAAAVADPSST
ncbi:hypothetical protein [Saccharothrix obliqua]|uniref:hypothetical protein n=1 Tax=Saccharothrix obliqua TaxID=2861747 RepID=UPI001C5D51E3|nr:hypothetical protein [Saccharothrix obliqua]MBW4722416.1 hypothetical protein [Saccharothrix obliqua]